ncbi:MAG: diguanylate cyclase [Anaerolineaceae bacterium]|nr:diguanylate cyclase [Anaerolineaceae bacterium]
MNLDSSSSHPFTSELVLSQPFIDSIPNGLIVSDTQFRLLMVNRWVTQKLGLDPANLIGNPLGQIFPELEERNLLEAYRLVHQSNMPLTLSNRIHRYFIKMPAIETYQKSFSEMPQSVVISPLFEEGRLVGTVTSITDVTERVITERAIQSEVQKLNALHDIDHALSTLDIDQILQTIIQNSLDLFQAESATLYLVDGTEYKIAIQKPMDGSIALSEELLSLVTEKRSSVSVIRKNTTPSDSQKDAIQLLDLAAPLFVENQLIGVLCLVIRKKPGHPKEDITLLDTLASRAAVAIFNARLHRKEKKQRELLESLKDITISLTSELDPAVVLDSLLESIAAVSPYDSVRIIFVDNNQLKVVRQRGYNDFGFATFWNDNEFTMNDFPYLQFIAQKRMPIVISDTQSDPNWQPLDALKHVRSCAGAPIFVRGKLIGFLLLEKIEPGYYSEDHVNILGAFSVQAGIALENTRLYNQQKQLAAVDGLTGIANRRALDEILTRELERTRRYEHKTSLIILDIDFFKRYNDTYGHLVGDAVLKNLATLMQLDVRLIDTAGRYGGEEFLIILPETDKDSASIVAERLCKKVSQMHLNPPLPESAMPDQQVTISLGVSTAPDDAQEPDALIQAADQALYQAKNDGRNRVCIFGTITS